MSSTKRILVTGAAGFIGYHLCERLLADGHQVLGLDNINDYYDVNLKYSRLKNLGIQREEINYNTMVSSKLHPNQFRFIQLNLEDRETLPALLEQNKYDCVINLAAQAGVRYSIENPMAYVDSNIVGFVNILEACRQYKVPKLLYASSSSVYGNSEEVPFSTENNVDHPISMYAATKKSNELMAHAYSHLFGIQTIGLRFFTVYGPWGRPDMAMFLFTDAILNNKPLKVFNNGDLSRDFTYIDDIIDGIMLIVNDSNEEEKYQLFNIGNNKPVQLLEFIEEIEKVTGKTAQKVMMAMQPGDVNQTWADIEDLKEKYKYNPVFSVNEGVAAFVAWYRQYYGY